jgi:hypothetical protein
MVRIASRKCEFLSSGFPVFEKGGLGMESKGSVSETFVVLILVFTQIPGFKDVSAPISRAPTCSIRVRPSKL